MSSNVVIDDPRDGTEIRLDLGARVLLALPTPGATGHRWEAAEVPEEVVVTEEDGDLGEALPGAMSRQRFGVHGVHSGDVGLCFALRRPWEPQPINERRLRIRVGCG